jgi:S1-C subfamily serine protease
MFVSENQGELVVAGVYADAPAARAKLKAGDTVRAVAGRPVAGGLPAFFRSVWAVGAAGCAVPLTVERDGRTLEIAVASVDRRDVWRAPDLH